MAGEVRPPSECAQWRYRVLTVEDDGTIYTGSSDGWHDFPVDIPQTLKDGLQSNQYIDIGFKSCDPPLPWT